MEKCQCYNSGNPCSCGKDLRDKFAEAGAKAGERARQIQIDKNTLMGMEAITYCSQYGGGKEYDICMLAIEFGYQLALKYEEL